MWRWNTRTTPFFCAFSRKVGEPARAVCTVGRRWTRRDLDFQVTAEKCRDCDGLTVLLWTEGVQGAVVHQLCRLRPTRRVRRRVGVDYLHSLTRWVCVLHGEAPFHCALWRQLSHNHDGQVQKLQHCCPGPGPWDQTVGHKETKMDAHKTNNQATVGSSILRLMCNLDAEADRHLAARQKR
jgi:hypothetical protein